MADKDRNQENELTLKVFLRGGSSSQHIHKVSFQCVQVATVGNSAGNNGVPLSVLTKSRATYYCGHTFDTRMSCLLRRLSV